jgi:hypothetical protein
MVEGNESLETVARGRVVRSYRSIQAARSHLALRPEHGPDFSRLVDLLASVVAAPALALLLVDRRALDRKLMFAVVAVHGWN